MVAESLRTSSCADINARMITEAQDTQNRSVTESRNHSKRIEKRWPMLRSRGKGNRYYYVELQRTTTSITHRGLHQVYLNKIWHSGFEGSRTVGERHHSLCPHKLHQVIHLFIFKI